MKEGQIPSPEEMKKAENMMTEKQKHESSVREDAVEVGEKYFENYSESKEFSPNETAQAEKDSTNKQMTELAEKVNQSLASAAEQMKGISEIIGKNLSILNEKSANLGNLKEKSELKSEIAQIEEIMNWTVRLTKAPISKFDAERQKMTNRAFEDLLNSTETISDFVVHKKKEILEQETNEQKKQEITDSISKSEEAKEIRIQQQKDYLKTALESQEKWREKALKGYEEMEEGITKLLNEVKEEIEKVKSL